MRKPQSVNALAEFGRVRLSKHFFMRDFLFSDIAAIHGLANIPDDPDLAIAAGSKLCEELLEPIQQTFGSIAIRSAFRSQQVNGLGNAMQKNGKAGYNCAVNEENFAGHIWDKRDANGNMGATACIIVPPFWDQFQQTGDWQKLAWWIHDNLPYSKLEFFPKYWAFNVTWCEQSKQRISSFTEPRGLLTKPGMANNHKDHQHIWQSIIA